MTFTTRADRVRTLTPDRKEGRRDGEDFIGIPPSREFSVLRYDGGRGIISAQ
jgi:hypothetical protein